MLKFINRIIIVTLFFGAWFLTGSYESNLWIKDSITSSVEDVSSKQEIINTATTAPDTNTNIVDNQFLKEIIDLLKRDFYYQEFLNNQDELTLGAAQGMVESLGDDYTAFFPPQESKELEISLSGKLTGIGAQLEQVKDSIVIVSPIKGYPAEKIGIKAKDEIVKVNNESIFWQDVHEVVQLIRGEVGTEVKITVLREHKLIDFTIVREEIVLPSMDYKDLENGYFHLWVSRFDDSTEKEFQKITNEILLKDPQGLILDLRNNPGGYMQWSINLAGYWVDAGRTVVSRQDKNGNKEDFYSPGNSKLANIPTVVLINQGSASASEILAGALQDYKLVTLIGMPSFGKGSVQVIHDFTDGSSLKYTIALWLTPNGKNVKKVGLTPDYSVEFSEENIENEVDIQLEAAQKFLQGEDISEMLYVEEIEEIEETEEEQ